MVKAVKFEKATQEWPKTRSMKDGSIQVYGSYLPPAIPKRIDGVLIAFGMVVSIGVLVTSGNAVAGVLFALFMAGVTYFGLRPVARMIWSKEFSVKLFPDRIEMGRGWGRKRYSRAERIEFRVDQHQRAIKEQLEKSNSTTYRDAIEVIMQYGEKRIPIADMELKELEKAKALVIRLQDTCDQFDEALARLADGKITAADLARGDFGPSPDIR